jgi:Fe(3+) dicitrate transport protein
VNEFKAYFLALSLLLCSFVADARAAEDETTPPAGEEIADGDEPQVEAKGAEPAAHDAPGVVSMDVISIVGDAEDASRIGGSVTVVDESKLEEKEYDDIHRVLRQVPGVYAREEDGFGLRPNIGIRGASSDRSAKVTLMEDGILFGPAPYSAPAAYYFPLTTRMIGVEVFKGPASIQYGPHTVGGALNLVTRPIPNQPIVAADFSYGQRNSLKLHGWGGGRYKGFGLLIEGVRLESDGFKDLDGGGDTGFDRSELMLKGDYRWPQITEVDLVSEVKLGYSTEGSNETYLGISDDDFDRTPNRRYVSSERDRMVWDRCQYQLSQFVGFGPDLRFRFTAYRNDFDRIWRKLNRFEEGAPTLRDIFADPTGVNAVYLSILRGDSDSTQPLETLLVGTNSRDFVSQGVQLVGGGQLVTGPLNHRPESGIRLHYDEIVRDHTEDPFRMENRTLVPTGGARRQVADNTGESLAVAFYMRDEFDWGPLTLTPGLRVESIWTHFDNRLPQQMGLPTDSEDSQNVVMPGIGGVYFINDEVNLLAGVHRGFSPVAPGESDDADPEESVNYEAGVRYTGRTVSGLAIGYYNDYDNLLATCRQGTGCPPEDVDKQFNAGGVDIYGVEFLVDTEQDIGWGIQIPASLTYTFTHSSFRSSFNSASEVFGDVEKGDELPYVPEHQVTFSVGAKYGPLGTTTTLSYVGEMRDVAGKGNIPANELIEDHFVADLVAHWDFNDRGRLYLGIDNLSDNEYIVSRRPFGARPGLPFQVMGGIKYHLGG